MNKCPGCGDLTDLDLCIRCFRIRHYNEYKQVVKDNNDFVSILKKINNTKTLVLLVVDLLNIQDLTLIKEYLTNDILLVLTKRDLLPRKMYEEKLLYFDYGVDYVDQIIISSEKNYQFDGLLEKINEYKNSSEVYVVGFTNAGKSTMINKLLYNYANSDITITTSPLPSTTLDMIEIKLNDLTIYDTPGLLIEGDLTTYLDSENLKKVIPKKEIKPKTYQIKGRQTLITDYFIIEAENIDLTFYIANQIEIKRSFKTEECDWLRKEIEVNKNDILISGLGFIKTNKKSKIIIYSLYDVKITTRPSLI